MSGLAWQLVSGVIGLALGAVILLLLDWLASRRWAATVERHGWWLFPEVRP